MGVLFWLFHSAEQAANISQRREKSLENNNKKE